MSTPGLLAPLTAAGRATEPRTLVDIISETVAEHPDCLALDSGSQVLTYAELGAAALELADELAALGIGPGDRVGVRARSGTTDLYVAILGVLHAGAAYVPVDADDPDERARMVFGESAVAAVVGDGLAVTLTGVEPAYPSGRARTEPGPGDDAWVIFTSGSTGTPKGVAVSHRSAAAFVDAESRIFLRHNPIGPTDRVMAGLSVAFDASCEEMWLAWAHGACLVPAPRSLVRSGVDVGPWLVANDITIVSTVPTLVALWPPSSLERVRLLIMGGEACPPELAARLQAPGREVWNTYGPTEATVVACAAILDGSEPVRIGLPLDGWDLAVVDASGAPVAEGETGELVIGGVGLARYLDPAKDAEKYAPMPTLGWQRAYRSGDHVRNDPAGLVFAGRADDQVKLGGRRIELGEIDGQLLRVPGVVGAAAAVRKTAAGSSLLVGYVTVDASAAGSFDTQGALELLRARMPAALVPRLAVVDALPTRTSGKVDRDALPWPLPSRRRPDGAGSPEPSQGPSSAGPLASSAGVGEGPQGSGSPAEPTLTSTEGWLADIWADVLAADATAPTEDFFDFGGGSLTAAQVVGRIRERHPEVAVGDIYTYPTLGGLAAYLDGLGASAHTTDRRVVRLRRRAQAAQLLAIVPLRTLAAGRWTAWVMLGASLTHPWLAWTPVAPWWVVLLALVVFVLPPGRMALAAGLVRLVLHGVSPGSYPRGGRVHLRLWLAGRIQDELAATSLAGAPWFPWYARLLGCQVGRGADLHTVPPVTGMLTVGPRAAVETEVDLAGQWVDGDVVHVGRVVVGPRARVGARSMLGPGAVVGPDAEVGPGSYVDGEVPAGEFWSGSPAQRRSRSARGPWSTQRPPRGRRWLGAYGALSLLLGALPLIALLAGGVLLWPPLTSATSVESAVRAVLPWLPLAGLVGFAVLAACVLAVVRLLGLFIHPGHVPVRSAMGVAVWGTVRVLDEARDWLFPLYAGALTPWWLRLLGARIGPDVEASTVLMIPKLTSVGEGAFLADDTLIGGYELGGGWLRVDDVKIGKRAFVGNSGMAAPGRKVPKASLVAVLSAAPRRGEGKSGQSWMGSPPTRLRRVEAVTDDSRTYAPTSRLKALRAIVETMRLIPLLIAVALDVEVAGALLALLARGVWVAALLGGLVLCAAGLLAALLTVAAKWLLVGTHEVGEHPLWSGFVWRNELADTFTEVLAARWFVPTVLGTWVLNVWLRMLGARIGHGVWCDSYWLPETDLVELGDGATVNAGTVVQTHLFHDRVLALDRVVIGPGATLGPNSVILPAASIGRDATVGPGSLVMRGESVPSRTRWVGNPIGPWEES